MLLLIEHDHVMANVAARRCLADFVARRPNVTLALFRSPSVKVETLVKSYPPALRERLLVTPEVPRDRDLAFAIMYEVSAVTSGLRFAGGMSQCEPWLCLVPPAWQDAVAQQFGERHVMVVPSPFCDADARRLASSISSDRWAHDAPAPRNLASSPSAASMAPSSAVVNSGSRGKSAGQSMRSASSAKRSARSATILG
ncbi:hypothetical protein KTE91_31255 [Burkholderia multivorans]|uniref:hypothetical protein n=1 Tax=Burkholderia multivorans TaxID=87883 RepID=UPI001C20F882|nr:hypothetical protein [Burkholderia multivorans]MBU9439556.1 hypothetical protein [Burkholderia multivorans]